MRGKKNHRSRNAYIKPYNQIKSIINYLLLVLVFINKTKRTKQQIQTEKKRSLKTNVTSICIRSQANFNDKSSTGVSVKFGIFGICRALSFIYIFHFIILISIRSLDAIGFVFCRHTNLSYQHQNDEISLSVEISPVMILFTKHVCVCSCECFYAIIFHGRM